MSMTGYTKLFSSILTSSVWGEADHTRLVWITVLALADRSGNVSASVGGLARSANVTRERCVEAISVLTSPDPDDRSGVQNGIRLEPIQGGWHIVNYAAYRDKMRSVDRTEYLREKKRESRAKLSTNVNKSTKVNRFQPIAEAEATTEAKAKKHRSEKPLPKPSALGEVEFDSLWSACLRKVGKIRARKAYLRLRKAGQMPPVADVIEALRRLQATEQWTKQGRQYQPHLEAWLNRGGWDDEIPNGSGQNLEGLDAERIEQYNTGGIFVDNRDLQ